MGPGKRARAYSAGYLDKGEMNMLSRPGSQKVMTREWLTSMRDRGIIVSDATLRYQKWLSLSESQKPLSSQSHNYIPHTRPQTAPPQTTAMKIGNVRHNRCSTLRYQKLPETHAETDFKKLARNNKEFDRQCRCYTAMEILTENFPEDVTSHQFLIGSRYNYTNHIDSRSLSRLGIYIPRSDVAKTFINPAGIMASQGRVGSVITPTDANVTFMPSLMEIQQHIKRNRGSFSPVCSSLEEARFDSSDEDEKQLPGTTKKDGVWEDVCTYEGEDDMMVTEEAKELADRIVQESLTSIIISEEPSHTSIPGLGDKQVELEGKEQYVLNEDKETQENSTQQEIDLTTKSQTDKHSTKDKCHVTNDSITNACSETSVTKSSSTIIVDMTRLQIEDDY